ncbi:D-amino acid dehydrogenase [Azospirillum thermophilum]|uniref:D-amino acid dehydrogenase n=1 Tax=Azospirillum thermophilum TaxID=2202148 RepID=A0A2S2CLA4_9PROT|nr:D-amino acid dehydrogenase [Azospirillum thermophilum]AWK85209.1 D-amino acid dehydrogenase [Azospirillum thermophilum]
MRVIVLGSGVIGVTTAYYLARAGHEVTVVDRQTGPALETSYANAGEVSPGYSAPWASPGLLFKAIKWMAMKHSPLVMRPKLDPAMWTWCIKLLANANEDSYQINKSRMVRVAEYSRDCLRALRAETGIRYDERTQGTLQLFRTQKQMDAAGYDMAVLDRYGVPYRLLDRAGCVEAEPALALVKEKFVGGLQLPGDETGDCFLFTNRLAEFAAKRGVEFRYGVTIHRLESDGRAVTGVVTDQGTLTADAYIVAMGSYSPKLVKPLGLSLPVYPVKGYSLTLPITDAAGAPESTVMDETHKVAITRLGDRIRVGGTAELGGFDLTLRPERRRALDHVVSDLFPQGGDLSQAEFWTGLRPNTPDGTPILGKTPVRNLYLNTGHGTLGWTMAAGSGRLLADAVSGRRTEIEMDGLTVERYGRAAVAEPARPAAVRPA